MAKKEFKLWFSKKQKESFPDEKTLFGILEDGSIVEYTEAISVESNLSSIWSDAKLLGIGDYHHSE